VRHTLERARTIGVSETDGLRVGAVNVGGPAWSS
jgi:hypothetical protein